jgi:ABC-2 type transport system permease protein
LTGWAAGLIAYFLLIGLTAVAVLDFMAGNPSLNDMAGQAGFGRLNQVEGLVATLFAVLVMPLGAFAATRVAALAAAESAGRLTLLAAGPVHRIRLVSAEIAATAVGMAVLATAAATATWAGVTVSGGRLGLGSALAGTWNVLPVAMLSLGAAVVALGVTPRAVTAVGGLPTTGGFLLYVLLQTLDVPSWLRNVSPFAHLAPVPQVPVDWTATIVTAAVAVLLAAAGVVVYARRDLRS